MEKIKKMETWQKLLIVLFAIGIVGILNNIDEPTSAGSNDTKKTDTTKVDASDKKNFAINETITFKNVEYTVTNVKYSSGDEWSKPGEGKEYVIVTIKIENKSDKKIPYNSYSWKMVNSDGQEDNEAFSIINNETALNSGDLVAGGKKEGTIAFEEKKGDKGLKLYYYDNLLLDQNYTFQVKIK